MLNMGCTGEEIEPLVGTNAIASCQQRDIAGLSNRVTAQVDNPWWLGGKQPFDHSGV